MKDNLIQSLPDSIDGWKKREIRSGILRRKKTIFLNENKGSFIEVLPPDIFNKNQHTFALSIMGESLGPINTSVFYANKRKLKAGLKSAVKEADILYKNKIKTLKFVGAPKSLLKNVAKDISKYKLKKVI